MSEAAKMRAAQQAQIKARAAKTGGTVDKAKTAKTAKTAEATPKVATPRATPAGKKVVRRVYKEDDEKHVSPTRPYSPTSRAKEEVEFRLSQLSELAASGAFDSIDGFSRRRLNYLVGRVSNKTLYRDRCKDLGVAPDAELFTSLSDEELTFNLGIVSVSNRPANLESLLDLILMNPVQRIYFKKAGLKDADVQNFCETLGCHEFVNFIDLRNNADVSAEAAKPLKKLVAGNCHIARVDLTGTGVAQADQDAIARVCQQNALGREIGRSEFDYIKLVFEAMDDDNSGVVTKAELKEFAKKEKQNLTRTSEALSVAHQAFET